MGNKFFESPFFKKISRIADFFLGSLYFLICSIPVLTLFPALCALYYTMAKAVRYGSGKSTTGSFFLGFRQNLKQGLWLSVLCALGIVILYTMYDVARGVGFGTLYGRIYLILIPVYTIVFAAMLITVVPIVSRFSIKTLAAFKLALSFIRRHPWKILTYVIALAGSAALSFAFPPLSLVLPGGYMFSLTYLMEPMLLEYMREHPEETGEVPSWLEDALEESRREN